MDPESKSDDCIDSNALPWHEIPVRRFEIKLVWPVLLQWKRESDGTIQPSEADPELPGNSQFFEHWCKVIEDDRSWTEVGGGYPPLRGDESAPGYAEFCYFHPFVRNFLYVNRDDIRQFRKNHEHNRPNRRPGNDAAGLDEVAQSINRSLRVFSRKTGQADSADSAERCGQLTLEYRMDPYPKANDSDEESNGSTESNRKSGFQKLTTHFDVNSCWMYLFDTRIALLELDLRYNPDLNPDRHLNLRMVLKIQDIIRRLYAPYFDAFQPGGSNEVLYVAGHSPERLTLRFAGSNNEISSSYGHFSLPLTNETDADATLTRIQRGEFEPAQQYWEQEKTTLSQSIDAESQQQAAECQRKLDEAERQLAGIAAATAHRQFVYQNREPYSVEVWRKLLEPIVPTTNSIDDDGKETGKLRFEQIQDDRVPLMSYIAVDDPRQISLGDWQRLAAVDDEGDSSAWPYSPQFVGRNPLSEFAYDRFWSDDEYLPAQAGFHSTRWLSSGYSLTAVGRAEDTFFFNNAHSGALAHFRHHYFGLFMIAQFHRASLLRYKHALAEASDELLNGDETVKELRMADFRHRCQRLNEEFLRFRTRYWFSEVSNQIQGCELFNLLRKHLNLQQLFDDVKNDIEAAASLLKSWEEESQSRSSRYLALLGAVFLAVGPAIALWSESWKARQPFLFGFLVMLAIGSLVFAFWQPTWKPPRYQQRRRKLARWYHLGSRWLRWMWLIICGAAVVAIVIKSLWQ